MSNTLRATLLLTSTLLLTACSVGGSAGSPGSPGPGSSASPDGGAPTSTATPLAIDHARGASVVILRMSTGGGFMAPGFIVTEAPEFTLYGDGTIILRDLKADASPAATGPVFRFLPFRTGRLTEAQVQVLLAFALDQGGLRTALAEYPPHGIMDAPSTTFTIAAGGLAKTINVGALGFDQAQPDPDAAARKAFLAMADRLTAFAHDGTFTTTPYQPTAYRGFLAEEGAQVPASGTITWPWSTFGPETFVPSTGGNGPAIPSRTLSAAAVAELGLPNLEGGAGGIVLRSQDGKTYALSLRPLLPDEAR